MRRYALALGLFLIAALVAEFLLGNLSITMPPAPADRSWPGKPIALEILGGGDVWSKLATNAVDVLATSATSRLWSECVGARPNS